MATVAGYEVPDDIYQSMLNIVRTQKDIITSANIPGIGYICKPFAWLGTWAALIMPRPLSAICATAETIIEAGYAKIISVIQQGMQKINEIEQQAKAKGEKEKSITVRYYTNNGLLKWAEYIMTYVYTQLNQLSPQQILYNITHPLQSPQQLAQEIAKSEQQAQQFVINLTQKILQSGTNLFNSDTLPKINARLNQIGWNLKPVTVNYDVNSNTVYVEATFEALGSPEIPGYGWIAIGIVILLIIVAATSPFWMSYLVTLQALQTEEKLPGIIAQGVNSVLNNCLKELNNVQFCENLSNEYLASVQNTEQQIQSTTQKTPFKLPSLSGLTGTIVTIALIGVAAGTALIVLDYLKKREENKGE